MKIAADSDEDTQRIVLAPSPDISITYYYSYYCAVFNLKCLLVVCIKVKSHNHNELAYYPANQPLAGKDKARLGNKSN